MSMKYQKWLILIAVTLGLSMDLLDMTVVNVAIPKIMIDFGTDIHSTQHIVTAYMVTIGLFEHITAYWADTHWHKKALFNKSCCFYNGFQFKCASMEH